MSGGATASDEAAQLVAAEVDQNEKLLCRELVGDQEEEMEDDTGSELSALESSVAGEMAVDEATEGWEGQARRRPNYKRAAPSAGQQSTQEFFRRGARLSMGEVNIFDTPEKTPMRGALARALSAVGTPETLNSAKALEGRGGKLDVGASDWADEMANEVEMESVADSSGSTTPTPPTRWPTPTPVPVTPTRGSKRMAMGTPRPIRQTRPTTRPRPVGGAAAPVLEHVLAAIAGMERRMEEKMAALEGKMMQGMTAITADADARAAGLLEDAEEREKRVAVKLLATEAIESELGQKARWELGQWEKLDGLMELRREDLRKMMGMVDGIATEIAEWRAASRAPVATPAATSPEAREDIREVKRTVDEIAAEMVGLPAVRLAPPPMPATAPALGPTAPPGAARGQAAAPRRLLQAPAPAEGSGAPDAMEGVVTEAGRVKEQEDQIAEPCDMEGVEREGMIASQHAPPFGTPAESPAPAPKGPQPKKKKKEGMGKGKEVAGEAPPSSARVTRQRARQAEVDRVAAEVGEKRGPQVTPAVPQSILKCPPPTRAILGRPETAARESKAEAGARWEKGDFSKEEEAAYLQASMPIRALDYGSEDEEAVLGRVAGLAGMRAVENWWENERERESERKQESRVGQTDGWATQQGQQWQPGQARPGAS